MSSAHENRTISAIPMTNGEAMVFALAHSALVEAAEPLLTEGEMTALKFMSSRVIDKLHRILTGEVEDESSERLPDLSFLRHCGTPLVDRYYTDMGLAMRDSFGAQAYERLRDALASQLISL